mgnify:CR=1 FL=1
MQLHLDEQLSRLHLSGMKQALNQQQAQSLSLIHISEPTRPY